MFVIREACSQDGDSGYTAGGFVRPASRGERKAMQGLITAFRTLTVLPVPGRDSEDFAASLPWFPVIGLILGVLLALAGGLWDRFLGTWFEGAACLLLAGSILLTRGLHLDGLADWADALGGRPEREVRLAILKDSSLGAFGGLALGMVLLLKWVALVRLLSIGAIGWIVPALIVSRTMMAELTATLPYARSGPGTAGPFVQGATGRRRIAALVVGFALALAWGLPGILCFALGWLGTRVFSRHCRATFGGVTGDLLGSLNELLETGLLFLLCGLPWGGVLWYS